ncbi:MAG: glutamate---cysteine ligase / carboxylate-amine ligase [Solirubrobacteraceae bacterium]|nr:glutamate---cysteine ligase / carboxylate-amine ligase [Solirubrobacteraceae bacterium]
MHARKPTVDPDRLRAPFDAVEPLLVGIEEELMLLDADSLDLAPRASDVLGRLPDDPRFKLELAAAQIEIATPPEVSVAAAGAQLSRARAELAAAAGPELRLAGAGTHPFADPIGELSRGARYDRTRNEYGELAQRQLIFGLHVHVGVGDADRALAIHDALRSYLPEITALAANAPFHAGRDTGLASVRPSISDLLPRQGVPPVLRDWQGYADALTWGAASEAVPEPRRWWWAMRLHPAFGTVELRAPDAQASLADTLAVAALVHALVARLAERHAAGEKLAVAPTWRIEENRWSAARSGVLGEMADLVTGERAPTARRLHRLFDELEPLAERLGGAASLRHARTMVRAGGGAAAQRETAAERGLDGLVAWLAEQYEPGA